MSLSTQPPSSAQPFKTMSTPPTASLPIKKRTRARELCLQVLYQYDLVGESMLESLGSFLREEETDKDTRAYAEEMVVSTIKQRDTIDERIQGVAQNWKIGRMAVIDRNVLRLATFELVFREDIPPKVAINEAIELGKRFSTSNSGAFINGILDKIKSGLPASRLAQADGTDAKAPEKADTVKADTEKADTVKADNEKAIAEEPVVENRVAESSAAENPSTEAPQSSEESNGPA